MGLLSIVLLVLELGVKTPGVQIPFSKLKPEAQISLASPAESLLVDQSSLWLVHRANNTLGRIDPKLNTPGDPITGLSQPCGVPQTGFGDLWVLNCGDGTLARIDAKSFKVKSSIKTGAAITRTGLAVTSDSVWVFSDNKTTMSRIDPDQDKVVAELRIAASCNSMIAGEGALWVACTADNLVLRIDPSTNLVTERITVAAQPFALAAGDGAIWVLTKKDGKVERIDPKTNKVDKTIELFAPDRDGDIAVGEGSVWVSLNGFPISRIDPKTNAVVQQFVGEGGGVVRVAQGQVWLLNQGAVWKLEPRRIAATLAE